MYELLTPSKVAQEIDNNNNSEKAPGIHEISPGPLKELSKKSYRYGNIFI